MIFPVAVCIYLNQHVKLSLYTNIHSGIMQSASILISMSNCPSIPIFIPASQFAHFAHFFLAEQHSLKRPSGCKALYIFHRKMSLISNTMLIRENLIKKCRRLLTKWQLHRDAENLSTRDNNLKFFKSEKTKLRRRYFVE